jgi:hypothetical protein
MKEMRLKQLPIKSLIPLNISFINTKGKAGAMIYSGFFIVTTA